MIVNIQVRAFSFNKLQLFSYTILEDYQQIYEVVKVIKIKLKEKNPNMSASVTQILLKQNQLTRLLWSDMFAVQGSNSTEWHQSVWRGRWSNTDGSVKYEYTHFDETLLLGRLPKTCSGTY